MKYSVLRRSKVETDKRCTACHISLNHHPLFTQVTLPVGTVLYYCLTCDTLQRLGIIDSVGSLLVKLRSDDASA